MVARVCVLGREVVSHSPVTTGSSKELAAVAVVLIGLWAG